MTYLVRKTQVFNPCKETVSMYLLLIYLFIALGFSFLCSLLESALLSTTPGFVGAYEKKSPNTGRRLRELKEDIDRPLSAILSLNTIAHTFGATGVGAQALIIFGNEYVAITSAVLTLLILVLSEIIPKTVGALFWRELAPFTTHVLRFLIVVLYPLVFLSKSLTQMISREKKIQKVSREEIQAIADIGYREGAFREDEFRIIRNLFRLRHLQARDIMTPRTVMFALPSDMTVCHVAEKYADIRFSRIPVYKKDPDATNTFVLKSDIYLEASQGNGHTLLSQIERPLLVLPETISLINLFNHFIQQHQHAVLAVDEHGSVSGIVTMEDVLETLLGIEIVDETDSVVDMRALARQQWQKRAKAMGITEDLLKDKPG